MTLTKQWKKGELPRGWYYVVLDNKETNIALCKDLFTNCGRKLKRDFAINDITKVLAPVPTYQEYLESEAHCAVYSDENKHLNLKISGLQAQNAELIETNDILSCQNKQFRQLLKECKDIIEWYKADAGYVDLPTENILTRINASIGESEE